MSEPKTFTKEEMDAAVEAAVAKVQESIDRLEAKNSELVADIRKARKAGEIKPEDLAAAEERADKAEAALSEANKAVKAATGERDKAVKALETESGFTQRLLIQDGIKSALLANGVKDEDFIDSLTAKFAVAAKVVVEGDERKAVYDGKPLGDFIKEWAGSDTGKKFVEAPVNGGGGSGGGSGKGSAPKTMLRSAFEALPTADQSAFIVKEGGTVVDAAA
jgi:hypothetical protein